MVWKFSLKSSGIEIQISNGVEWRNDKTKVVDLEELYNFVVDNFFVWNHVSKEN